MALRELAVALREEATLQCLGFSQRRTCCSRWCVRAESPTVCCYPAIQDVVTRPSYEHAEPSVTAHPSVPSFI